MRHTRLFVFSILLALLAAMPASAQGEFEWVLAREYTSLEFHDPGLLMLRDAGGTESGLEFGYEGLTYEVVETSPQGKKIRVACTPERGSEVIDPESDERYPIRSAPPPIDELQSRCLEREESTIGMSACHAEADAAWDLELNRAYQDVMESD